MMCALERQSRQRITSYYTCGSGISALREWRDQLSSSMILESLSISASSVR